MSGGGVGRRRMRLGVETRARFATGRDLAPLVVQRPVPSGRFVLGCVHGRLVATEDRRAADAAGKRRSSSFRQGDRGLVLSDRALAVGQDGQRHRRAARLGRTSGRRERQARPDRRHPHCSIAVGTTRVFDPSGAPSDDLLMASPGGHRCERRHPPRRPEGCCRSGGIDPAVGRGRGSGLLGEAGRIC